MINDKLHVERNRRELPRNIITLSHVLGTFVVRSSHESCEEVAKAECKYFEVDNEREKMNFTFSLLRGYIGNKETNSMV